MVRESVGGEASVRSESGGPDEWRFRSFAGREEGEPSAQIRLRCEWRQIGNLVSMDVLTWSIWLY